MIVPTSDSDLMLFARHREKFERIGTRVLVPDIATVEICRDKIKFAAFCKRNGFAVPQTYSQKDFLHGKVRFPVFVRGRYGMGSRGAVIANDRKELLFYLRKIPQPIVQEYIRMKEYTIDLFADFDGRVISVIPRERITTVAGESFVGKTVWLKPLINGAIRIADKLKLIGHNTIQCFFDGRKQLFIEVNARYGGGASLGFAAGADTPSYLAELLLCKVVAPRIGKFKKDFIMLRYTEDLFMPARDIQWKIAK